MPEEYQDWTRTIICNDCEKENVVKYNFFYHKVGERRGKKAHMVVSKLLFLQYETNSNIW